METQLPPCAMAPEMYQDEILLSPPNRRDVSAAEWREFLAKRAAAHRRCAGCAVLTECLYRCVVEVDVSGFVACTSEVERRKLRKELGVTLQTESNPYGTARVGGGPVNHDEVIAARRAHPDDTCRQLAERLGCSTSTVKRHLRQEREKQAETVAVAEKPAESQPTMLEVLDAFDRLESSRSTVRS